MSAAEVGPGTPGEILAKALKKEEAAYRFYDALSRSTKIRMVRELLNTLKDEEAKHVRMIKKKMAELARG